MTDKQISNIPSQRIRCPICGNEEYLPLEKIKVKNEKYPDISSTTLAQCVGCGNVYCAIIEKVVRV